MCYLLERQHNPQGITSRTRHVQITLLTNMASPISPAAQVLHKAFPKQNQS